MSQRHGGAFFMGSTSGFAAPYGPWYAAPARRAAMLAGPVRAYALAQAAQPIQFQPGASKDWASKIETWMKQVQAIQDYVKAHPAEAAAAGLDKDAANLPASGDIASYPKLKIVYDKLMAEQPVTQDEMACVPALQAALIPANEKLTALQGQAPSTLLTPTNIGIGAGILALAVGLVVLS